MEETRRLIRFVMPGAVFGLLSLLLLMCLIPGWVQPRLAILFFRKDTGLASAVAGVIGSGALGYVFSSVHHELNSLLSWLGRHRFLGWLTPLSSLNYSAFVARMMDPKNQLLRIEPEGALGASDLDRDAAQAVVSALWFDHLSTNGFAGTDAKCQGVSDTAQALGIARIATLAALGVSVIWAAHIGNATGEHWAMIRSTIGIVVGVVTVVVFWLGYVRVGGIAQCAIEHVLCRILSEHKATKGEPVTLRFTN